jgi:hypothetical protein
MIKTQISGSFSVKVLRNKKVIISLPRQDNLILQGKMSSLSAFGTYIHVGTGNNPPLFSDTSLNAFLGSQVGPAWAESSPVLNGSTYEKEDSTTFTFPVGGVVGNLAELGVSSSPAEAADLHTRALFKDGVGDPTTVTVTALDQLVITYFVKKHVTMSTTTLGVILDGNTIDYTIRPCIANAADAGSQASYPSSIYTTTAGLHMTVNDTNRISVNATTFIPTLIDSAGDVSPLGSSSVLLTGTGNEVTHTITMPIGLGNFQWGCGTVSKVGNELLNNILFQIEFNGPNYITKVDTETITFKIKETITQAT